MWDQSLLVELDQFKSRVPNPLVQAGAARVQELCIQLDQSPTELANYLGLPVDLVIAMARGQRPVSVALLAELNRRAAN